MSTEKICRICRGPILDGQLYATGIDSFTHYDREICKANEAAHIGNGDPVDAYLECGHSKWDSRTDCITCLRFAVDELNKRLAAAHQTSAPDKHAVSGESREEFERPDKSEQQ